MNNIVARITAALAGRYRLGRELGQGSAPRTGGRFPVTVFFAITQYMVFLP